MSMLGISTIPKQILRFMHVELDGACYTIRTNSWLSICQSDVKNMIAQFLFGGGIDVDSFSNHDVLLPRLFKDTSTTQADTAPDRADTALYPAHDGLSNNIT